MVKLSLKRKAILATSMLFMIPTAGHAASNAELDALKAQIQALTNKVNELETKQDNMPAPVAAPAPVVQIQSNPKLPESITIPGTKTSVKIGGFAKLDTIYDIGTSHNSGYANFAAIPLDGSAAEKRSGEFNMHARQSRLNFTTLTETSMGDLKTFVEGDFFGADGEENVVNGHGFRLRHAYGEFMGIRAGQTWSNFMDMDVYPESLDYIGPVGITLMRVPQFGYGQTIDKFSYRVSLENPSTDMPGDTAVAPAMPTYNKTERMPDLTISTKYADTWGHVGLAGMLRQLRAEDAVTTNDDTATGFGVALSSKLNLPFMGAKDNLKARVIYGDGLGRYIFDTRNQAATYNGATQDIDTQSTWGGHVALQHWWTDTLRSNLMGGYVDTNTNANAAATANEKIWSAHANIIWQPVPKYQFGIEYMHGERETKGNVDGSLDRVQGSFIYSF